MLREFLATIFTPKTDSGSTTETLNGSGVILSESRFVGDEFQGIEVAGECDVIFTRGPTSSVDVHIDANLLPYVKTSLRENILSIGMEPGRFAPTKRLKVEVCGPRLSLIMACGSCSIEAPSLVEEDLVLDLMDESTVLLGGQITKADMTAAGKSQINAVTLALQALDVSLAGSARASVNVAREIKVSGSDAFRLEVYGSPRKRDLVYQGDGQVKFFDPFSSLD